MQVVYRRQNEHFYSMPALLHCGWIPDGPQVMASNSGQSTALLLIKSRALSVCHEDATGLSFHKHSFYRLCLVGCEYRGGRTQLLEACPQQLEIFDSHFMSAAAYSFSSPPAASSFLGGQLVSHVLCTHSSMLTVDVSISLVAQCLWPWSPSLGS